MIHSKRFFGKRLKRALLSAIRTTYNHHLSADPVDCPECQGSGISEFDPMETCQSCNGSGINSFVPQSVFDPLAHEQLIPSIENLINDFEDLALLINNRYSYIAAHYRDW